jgi:hypothetical protein
MGFEAEADQNHLTTLKGLVRRLYKGGLDEEEGMAVMLRNLEEVRRLE